MWKRNSLPPSATATGFLASLHRKLRVTSSADSLYLRPFTSNAEEEHTPYIGAAVRIRYGTRPVPEHIDGYQEDAEDFLLADGVVGLLRGPGNNNFLILLTDASIAATLPDDRQSTIKSINSLLAIPLNDGANAKAALAQFSIKLAAQTRRRAASTSTGGDHGETDGNTSGSEDDDDDDEGGTTTDGGDTGTETEADARPPFPKVVVKRPFWAKLRRTLSSKSAAASTTQAGVAVEEANTSQSTQEDTLPRASISSLTEAAAQPVPTDPDVLRAGLELDRKVLGEVLRTMRGMYFSYSIDVTRSLQAKDELRHISREGASPPEGLVEPNPTLPLWRRADKRFFWNAHLMQPFIEAGLHKYVLPIMQGFVGHVPSVKLPLQHYSTLTSAPATPAAVSLDLTIISRRSVERPGLRYQRRGVNDDGEVANFVETEFIAAATRDSQVHVASFVQTRGSIPVFWGQSPWALKPPPVLERTPEESRRALNKHFERQLARYKRQIIVNLAENSSKEGVVVEAYREGVKATQKEESVKYVEFDFHHECRGMRYENISKLITALESDLEEMQSFWTTSDRSFSSQVGTVRTNCIDCLDRTNVVQSAVARWALDRHLIHIGVASQQEVGMHDALDRTFSALWADNGDAISREYAGTSALKGDFVRTGVRNWRGQFNDATNSIARLLQSTVSDFFRQATLDYVLGVNPNAFQEFSERLETSDPGNIIHLRKIREEAIDTAASQVLSAGEEKIDGWTLLSPSKPDAIRSPTYVEKILLISNKALYVVEYNYTLQKPVAFTRVPTGDLISIQMGAYHLSSLEPSSRDPVENYGFIMSYSDQSATERVHTYTLKSLQLSPKKGESVLDTPNSGGLQAAPKMTRQDSQGPPRFFAFKALRRDAVRSSDGQSRIMVHSRAGADDEESKTAKAFIESIVDRVTEEAAKAGAIEQDDYFVVTKDIISLADSRAHTTIAERLGRSLVKAIWW